MPDPSPYVPGGLSNMLTAVAQANKSPEPDKLPTKPGTTPDWYRSGGEQKGMGFLGPLKFTDPKTGKTGVSTELSIGVNIGGKEVEIPSLVPTLNADEIQHLVNGGKPTPEIIQKAVAHAIERIKAGKSPFAGPEDYPNQGQ